MRRTNRGHEMPPVEKGERKMAKRYNSKGMASCYKGKKFDFEESLCDTVREARQQESRKKIQYA